MEAIGTKEKPITFTSMYDPDYYEGEYTPHWWGISIDYYESSLIANHIKVKYGSNNIETSGNLTLINSEISNARDSGIAIDIDSARFGFVPEINIKYNTFKNNRWAVEMYTEQAYIDLSYNYWDSIYGPEIGIGIIRNWYLVEPNMYDFGEKILLIHRYDTNPNNVDYKQYVNILPYLGSEMNINLKFNRNQGTYSPTGNYSKQFTDLSINTLGDSIEFNRFYNSANSEVGVFGKGWSFNYQSTIKDYNNYQQLKEITLPDGSREYFIVNNNGSYTPHSSRSTLIKNNDGSYVLKTKEQIIYKFNTKGLLEYIETKEGNRSNITYNVNGLPQTITDSVGREYTFSYNANKLLSKIMDPYGRSVTSIIMI